MAAAACAPPPESVLPPGLPLELLEAEPDRGWYWVDREHATTLHAGVGTTGLRRFLIHDYPRKRGHYVPLGEVMDQLAGAGATGVPLLLTEHGMSWRVVHGFLDHPGDSAPSAVDWVVRPGEPELLRLRLAPETPPTDEAADVASLSVWSNVVDARWFVFAWVDRGWPATISEWRREDRRSAPTVAEAIQEWLAAVEQGARPVLRAASGVSTRYLDDALVGLAAQGARELDIVLVDDQESSLFWTNLVERELPLPALRRFAGSVVHSWSGRILGLGRAPDGGVGVSPAEWEEILDAAQEGLASFADESLAVEMETSDWRQSLDQMSRRLLAVARGHRQWECRLPSAPPAAGAVGAAGRQEVWLNLLDLDGACHARLRLLYREDEGGKLQLSALEFRD